MKWYTLAAEQGLAISQLNLGLIHANGEGVLQDYQTAVKWYILAAKQGFADAQYTLGFMYKDGKGVPRDDVSAHMWSNIAASQGNEDAAKTRDTLAKEMTSAEISTAQELARECVAKEYKGC